MTYKATVVKVMIASPSDVPTERMIVRDVIHEWNAIHSQYQNLLLTPVAWETHASPRLGDRPQQIINDQVADDCDLLIGIFWTRLGTPTGSSPSGTVEEIWRHVDKGKPAMLYFSNAPVHPDSVDEEQYRGVREFRKAASAKGLIEGYESIGEFREKLAAQLARTVLREFTAKLPQISFDPPDNRRPIPDISPDGTALLKRIAQDKNGTLIRVKVMGGTIIQTGGQELAKRGDARSEARWEAAMRELRKLGFLEAMGAKEEVFKLTHAGYEAVDGLGLGEDDAA